ncbi:hypothetical protein OG799_15145 [Micromonospora sp. NBC_00898]|uniref:hypothetical protein n=1 Tax=Micromonospora sp. NBC_00898 TaxID=2975981 RepID=UPI003864C519|nr:hypothetical protein OG799_15145 [Micromonospora sp. NBC_00898]
MRRPRPHFTVRVRLTLLYTGLFAACGAIVVAITYGLLAANLPDPAATKPDKVTVQDDKALGQHDTTAQPNRTVPADFAAACQRALRDPAADATMRAKCESAYKEGLLEGAKSQRAGPPDAGGGQTAPRVGDLGGRAGPRPGPVAAAPRAGRRPMDFIRGRAECPG